jgi:ElaB/YqjD/DUF883 family membrane-anchored ribosome-binding protein
MNTRTTSDSQSKAGTTQLGPATSKSPNVLAKAGEAASAVTDTAQEVAGEAKRTALSLAAEVNQGIKGILKDQVVVGADLIGNVAESARAAAEKLDQNAPQIASMVRDAAGRMEEFSRDLRGRSVNDLVRITSDFARRKPEVLFGAAAAFGFLIFRVMKSTSPRQEPFRGHPGSMSGAPGSGSGYPNLHPESSPPISPRTSQFHGV